MAYHRIVAAGFLTVLTLLAGCATKEQIVADKKSFIRENIQEKAEPKPAPASEIRAPDFVPVTEDISPLKTKLVNIVVRNSSLGDVLHVIAEATGLNLLIDKDVAIEQPVTLTLRNVSADVALKTLFSSVDYFYSVRNNVLKVETVGTRMFELGHPAVVNTYSMEVGGDILGGAVVGGSSSLKGSITQGGKADTKAQDFWESLEKSLESMIGKKEQQVTKITKTVDHRPATNQMTGQQPQQQGAASETTVIEKSSEDIKLKENQSQDAPNQSVIINRLTGTIVITATKKNLEKVERYVDNIRKVLGRQVMIEARIIEVQLNEGLNFGIDWSFMKNIKAMGGPVVAGFGALNLASRSFNDAVENSIPKFQLGVSHANVQALLTALKTQGDVKTLSNPKLSVLNGHTALMSVGRNFSYISKVTSNIQTGTTTPVTTYNVETSSILSGVMIGIVPFITENGDITLTITPITSDLVTLQEKPFGAAGNQTNITIPTVDLREMTTTVKVRDGQMVILGGLISRKETTSDEKIPFLGDIPYLGKLFTRINNAESRTELVVVMRPFLVNND